MKPETKKIIDYIKQKHGAPLIGLENFQWEDIVKDENITFNLEFFKMYENKMDLYTFVEYQNLTPDVIEYLIKKLDKNVEKDRYVLNEMTRNQDIPFELINEYKDKLNFGYFSVNKKLKPETLIMLGGVFKERIKEEVEKTSYYSFRSFVLLFADAVLQSDEKFFIENFHYIKSFYIFFENVSKELNFDLQYINLLKTAVSTKIKMDETWKGYFSEGFFIRDDFPKKSIPLKLLDIIEFAKEKLNEDIGYIEENMILLMNEANLEKKTDVKKKKTKSTPEHGFRF